VNHPPKLGDIGKTIQIISAAVAGGEENYLFLWLFFLVFFLAGCGLFAFLVFQERKYTEQTPQLTTLLKRLKNADLQQFQVVIDQSSDLISAGSEPDNDQPDVIEDTWQQDEAEVDTVNFSPETAKEGVELSDQIGSFQLQPQELRDEVGDDLSRLESLCKQGVAQTALLEKECEQERQLGELARQHGREISGEQQKLSNQSHRIQVVEQGIELVKDGIVHMSRRFNSDVLEY